MKTTIEWFYRSIIAILLGMLVYFFQRTDRRVDDLTNRLPQVEAQQRILAKEQGQIREVLEVQAGDLRKLLERVPEPKRKR